MGKFASTWPRSRGSTPTGLRRCGVISRPTPAERAEAKAESTSEDDGAIWEVKDNGGKGGLVVYERKAASWLVAGRLTVGARLQELAVEGDFFNYQKLFGDGPSCGWVRMQLDGVQSIERLGCEDEEEDDDNSAVVKRTPKPTPKPAPVEPSVQIGSQEPEDPLVGARVWIAALGTRGELQPCVALGMQLRRAGCAVRLFGPAAFGSLASAYGVAFRAVGDDFDAFWNREQELRHKQLCEVYRLWVERDLCSANRAILAEMRAGQPDLLIVNGSCLNAAAVARQTYGIPAILLHVRPLPLPMHAKYSWPIHADFSYVEHASAQELPGAAPLQLTSFSGWCELLDSFPRLLATSQLVTAAFPDGDEWEEMKAMAVGNLVIEEQRPLGDPALFGSSSEFKALQAFMVRSASMPVYVGYGGAVCTKGAQHMLVTVGSAIGIAGLRAIFATGGCGWSHESFQAALVMTVHGGFMSPGDASWLAEHFKKNVMFVEAAPHEWLLMRCSCSLHHGGSSTTVAALRSGMPTVITPIKEHHHFNANWINALGVGVGLNMPLDDAKAEELAAALQLATQETKIRFKAREVGRAVRKEDGAAAVLGRLRKALSAAHRRGGAAAGEELWLPSPRAFSPPEAPKVEAAAEDAAAAAGRPEAVWVISHESSHEHTFVALAAGLRRAGFRVKLLGARCSQEPAVHCGLDFVPICEGPDDFLRLSSTTAILSGADTQATTECTWEWLSRELAAATSNVLTLMERDGAPDLLVLHRTCAGIGVAAHRRFGTPVVGAYSDAPYKPDLLAPQIFDYVPLAVEGRGVPWPEKDEWERLISDTSRCLVSLPVCLIGGLSPEHRAFAESFAFTNFWALGRELPSSASEERKIEEFLADGRPAVLVAFGDVICRDSGWMGYVLVAAARFAGLRPVVVEGTAQLDLDLLRRICKKHDDPMRIWGFCEANALFVKAYPPVHLLRRFACAFHHGGLTITGTVLHAGLPSVVAPFTGDQFLHAQIVQDTGVGESVGDLRNVGMQELIFGLRSVASNEPMRTHAATFGEFVVGDGGVQAAVSFVSKQLETRSGVG